MTKITETISEVSSLFLSAINDILINEHRPNQGIMVTHSLKLISFILNIFSSLLLFCYS
ncbi:hypothetical protein HanHA300_Chr03g0088131 [Helianthus annuus]|nr:hypothetical protein HanHA300_Chr03g0088131 [Helianthus annuus]KAJ0607694.1 hypothetical protein HanHA89_Chr03g0099721 [Helianthus annuus]KAJ0767759.1 hypothetical protein HanLR1_Chr03g0093101 [Helianthus annuus]KAJ0773556.1 hypothetical protein HanOQP8_Chr03g0100621 [Helianthus annuus]